MKRLWLLRHLKSSWDEPGLPDHSRPLAPRGHKAGKRIRRWLAVHEVRPDLVLCSTAARTRETLALVAPALGSPIVEFEDSLYHAWADDLLEHIHTVAPGHGGVLLIGHNPGLHELVTLLAPPGPDTFPTGALAELRIEGDTWQDLRPGDAELVRFVVPRELTDPG